MLPYQYILFYPILYFPCPSTLIQHLHDSVPNVLSWLLFQFSSVTQSCPTLCNPMDCSTPGFPVHHQLLSLLKLMSIESVIHATISSSVVPFSSCLQSFPALRSFPMSQFFTSGDQRIRASASVSVLPVNIQD